MATSLGPSALAKATGISRSYACEILGDKATPSQALAISIFQKTGRKFGPVAGMPDENIEALANILGVAA